MTVFVVQEVVGKNILSAERYGDLELLLPEGSQLVLSTAPTVRRLKSKLNFLLDQSKELKNNYEEKLSERLIDTLFVYTTLYDTTTNYDTTFIYTNATTTVYDTVLIIDSIYINNYDTTTIIQNNYDTTIVLDTTLIFNYDTVFFYFYFMKIFMFFNIF